MTPSIIGAATNTEQEVLSRISGGDKAVSLFMIFVVNTKPTIVGGLVYSHSGITGR